MALSHPRTYTLPDEEGEPHSHFNFKTALVIVDPVGIALKLNVIIVTIDGSELQ